MDKIPQQTITKMRDVLEVMDISPAKKSEMVALLDSIESKGGIAPKELDKLGKLIEVEEKQIKTGIDLAKQARKTTSDFIKKTDLIFESYSKALNK